MGKVPSCWVIRSVREDGNRFRPSDWIERISASVAQFGPDRRLRYASSVHPQVIPALGAVSHVETLGALGILETFSMTAALRAADQAVKSADVQLVEIRLGRGLAGKLYRAMVEHARANGLKVTPTCSYVIKMFERFPEDRELLKS